MTTGNKKKALLELYYVKRENIEALYHVNISQKDAVLSDKIENIYEFLTKRQVIMDNIDLIDSKIVETNQPIALIDKEELERVRTDINSMLQKLINLDNEIKLILNQKSLDIKQKLKFVNEGKAVQRAYGPYKRHSSGFFLDKKK